jgi:iron complex outermembrane recepter protein
MCARLPRPSAQIATAVSGILRALSICAPVAFIDISTGIAQTAEPAALSADIPAQPLASALTEFAHQTGLQLVYVSEVVGNQKSHAVPAGLSAREGLARLLEGTGLRFEFQTADSVRIVAPPRPQAPTAAVGDEAVREVIVTADRRKENLQDVPITIQTFSGEQLRHLGVSTFNDLLQYTPNVTYSGNGPGTGNIFIRGLGFLGTGNQTQSTQAPFPSVALYLDDQPMQFPARNIDLYMADLERIEILEGPQGTLFGGGAQAGAIRYLTNKPKLDTTTGEVSAGYGITAGGAANTALNAILNLPLLADTLAARAVIFSERQGGYIDNVASTISYQPGSVAASTGAKANNAALVASDTNPVTLQGIRLSLLWKLNDAWNLLLQQNYQDIDADGYFYAYPFDSNGTALQPYQIAAFTPAYTKDRYESTAWTLNGQIGPVSTVYSGSFMIRHIEGQQDYSNYLRSTLGSYYGCIGTGAGFFNAVNFPGPPPGGLAGTKLTCYPPVGYWHDTVENQHQSHELRLSTDPQYRLRGIFGAFWEKFVIFDQMDFYYLRVPQCGPAGSPTLTAALDGGPACLSAVGPLPVAFANDPSLRENAAFGNDYQRGYKQLAAFGSVDFDIIPKLLTVTAGARHYHYSEFEDGSTFYSETTSPLILNHPNGACTQATYCGGLVNLSQSEGSSVSRANLTWHIAPDVMAYYTYSQGFRPAAFNRYMWIPGQAPIGFTVAPYCGPASSDPRCLPGGSLFGLNTRQYETPVGYKSDSLINNELGIKSEFLNHRVLLNASAYRMSWNDVQWTVGSLSSLELTTNGPSYTINGGELQLVARATERLTLQASGSWNRSEQTNTPCLISVGVTPYTPYNPTPAGQCITVIRGLPYTNPWGALGSSLPFSPAVQFNVRARYDWDAGVFRYVAMFGASHIASMHTAPENYPDGNDPAQNPPTTTELRYTIPAYTTYEGSLGVDTDNWTVQITGNNLTNVYGPANISSAQFIKADIPLRPRVVMAQFTYRF